MKQCNKSATVKFHMELLLILRPGSNLAVVRHLKGGYFDFAPEIIKALKELKAWASKELVID